MLAGALLAGAGLHAPSALAANGETFRGASTVSAAHVLARLTGADDLLTSYAVPIHIEARLHRLFTFHFGLNGMVYYKRPDRVALDMQHVPEPVPASVRRDGDAADVGVDVRHERRVVERRRRRVRSIASKAFRSTTMTSRTS